MSNLEIKLKVTADTSQARNQLDTLGAGVRPVKLNVNDADVQRALDALARLSGAGSDQTVNIDANTAGIADALRLLGELSAAAGADHNIEVGADTQALDDAMSRIEQLEQQLNGASAQATGFMGVLKGAASALLAAFTVDAIAANTVDLINFNKEINQMNAYLFVSREALQVWGNAGKQYGVEIADVLKDIQEKIGEFAATGGGEAVDVFKKLSLDAKELINLSPDQQLLKVAEAMSKVKDMSQGEKSFLLESLGNDATKLLPLLDNNAAKLREIDAIMRESGAIITADQNEVLTEAAHNLMLLETALSGVSNAMGMAGASIFNTFGSAAAAAIAATTTALTEMAAIAVDESAAIGDAWSTAFANMPPAAAAVAQAASDAFAWIGEAFDWVVGQLAQGMGGAVEYFRIGFTYLPQFAMAAFEAVYSYGESFAARFQALNFRLGAYWQSLLGSMVQGATDAFSTIADIGGHMVGVVLGQMSSTLSASAGALSYLPGMDDIAASLNSAVSSLDSYKAAADNAGSTVRASMEHAAAGYKAVETASLNAASVADAQAQAASANAKYALANASAMMVESEGNRERTIEMGAAERQFAKLGSSIDSAGTSGKKYRIDQEAVNKALDDGAGATKAKSAADKKSIEVIHAHGDALKSVIESLAKQRIELEHGKLAAEYYTDRLNGLTDAEARAKAGASQYNTLLEERKRLQREAAGLSGSLVDKYQSHLADIGLDAGAIAGIDAAKASTDQAVTAAQHYQSAIDAATASLRKQEEAAKAAASGAVSAFSSQSAGIQQIAGQAAASAAQIVGKLQSLGWSKNQSIGIAANLKQESEFRPTAVGDSGKAYGLAQWHPDRQANFSRAMGRSIQGSSVDDQLKFLTYELTKGSEKGAGNKLKNASSAAEAAAIISRYYERPAATAEEMTRRAGIANGIAKSLGDAVPTFRAVADETGKVAPAAAKALPVLGNVNTALSGIKNVTVEYGGAIDSARVSLGDTTELLQSSLNNEMNTLLKTAQQQTLQAKLTGAEYRRQELAVMQIGVERANAIMMAEQQANYMVELAKLQADADNQKLNAAQQYSAELEKQNLSQQQQVDLVKQFIANEQAKLTRDLEKQYKQAVLTDEQYRAWEISLSGVGDQFAAQTAASEKQLSVYKDLGSGLENALLSAAQTGFESFSSLADWLRDTFNNMVLKPIIQAVTGSLMGALMPSVGNAAGIPGMTTQGGGLQSLQALFTGNSVGSSVANAANQLGGLGGLFKNAGAQSNMAYGGAALLGGLFGDKMFGSGGGTGGAIGSTLGMAVAGPVGAAVGGVLGGLAGSIFGGKWETKSSGVELNYDGDITGKQYTEQEKKGGWLKKTKRKTDFSALDSELQASLNDGFDAIESGLVVNADQLKKLGFGAGGKAASAMMDGFTASAKIDLSGKSADEQKQAIQDWMNKTGQEMYRLTVGDIADIAPELKNSGEDINQTFTRLVSQMTAVDTMVKNLGLNFNVVGDASNSTAQMTAQLSDSLVELFGGLDKLAQATDYYYQNFFSETERNAKAIQNAQAELAYFNSELGLSGSAAIDTREEFKAYVQSLDLTTESGQKAYASAMQYTNAIVSLTDAMGAGTGVAGDLSTFLQNGVPVALAGYTKTAPAVNELDALPQYAVGSDYVQGDQAAVIHNSEMIFSATQSASLRDNVVSIVRSSRQAGAASNNNEALVSKLDELLKEIRGLNNTANAARRDSNQYSAIAIQQRRDIVDDQRRLVAKATYIPVTEGDYT